MNWDVSNSLFQSVMEMQNCPTYCVLQQISDISLRPRSWSLKILSGKGGFWLADVCTSYGTAPWALAQRSINGQAPWSCLHVTEVRTGPRMNSKEPVIGKKAQTLNGDQSSMWTALYWKAKAQGESARRSLLMRGAWSSSLYTTESLLTS